MDKKTLFEPTQNQSISETIIFEKHQSLVKEYFRYEEENKPQIIKDALREQIEKLESTMIASEEI